MTAEKTTDPNAFEILVAGGGTAGAFAAIAASQLGKRVLVVEPHNVLGGQGTAGGVAGFCGDSKRVNRPFAEIVDALEQNGFIAPYDPKRDRRPYDAEYYAHYLQERVLSSGAELLFHARLLRAEATEGRIDTVDIATNAGVVKLRPGMVIDATGECVAAHLAGFETYHEKAMKQLPMGLYFTMWNTGKPVKPHLPPGCPEWTGDNDIPMTTLHDFPSGKVEVKMKVVGFDAADPQSLTQAEIHARRQMMGLVYHLQTKGYKGRVLNTHVLAGASRHIGLREGRRIVGEHLLTETEILEAKPFDDVVAIGTYHLDYHWPDRPERAGTGITTHVPPYPIPLRCMIPRGAKNVLAAGRGMSGDQMAMSSFRVMATCAQTGFAAGVAAAVAIDEHANISDVPVRRVQRLLEEQGQSLDPTQYGEYLEHLAGMQHTVD